MRIWLLTVGEPLPTDPGKQRLLRTGLLAEMLVEAGHDVLWWTSTFDHARKRHRALVDSQIRIAPRYRIRMLHAGGYRRNVSLRRLLSHRQVADRFARLAQSESVPDLILCSLPLVELAEAATRFGSDHRVPVVLDVRDTWPDAIAHLAPRPARPLARLLLNRMERSLNRACRAATAICGISDGLVRWGLSHSGRQRRALDRSFPMAYRRRSPEPAALAEAKQYWSRHGLRQGSGEFVVCFFGTIGRHFEFDVVIRAARILDAQRRPVRIVMCGEGPQLQACRRRSAGCPSIQFPGWVDAPRIWTLMQMSSAGLAPYVSTPDFMMSVPNKPIEYLSAGLPIISSLQGTLRRLLALHACGLTYPNRDAEALARAVSQLHDSPESRQRMSARAASLYERHFVAENVYADMQFHLQTILEASRGATLPDAAAA